MSDDLVTGLLPVLGRSLKLGFNIFDVMHHGLHEKQISNVFRWLLDPEQTHNLGDRFLRIFIDELNRVSMGSEPLPHGSYLVRQEVDTSVGGAGADIADLVLESEDAVIVIENYFTSDGHGHSYSGYLAFSVRDGKRGVVALLCRDEDVSLQTLGWEDAAVLTYGKLAERLLEHVGGDRAYQRKNPDAYAFIEQLHRKFVRGRGRVGDQEVLNFVVAMCNTGEVRRYQLQPQDVAAERFAEDLAVQAKERFGEGRDLLQRAKGRLSAFSEGPLRRQLNATRGEGFVQGVNARFAGIYQWTINIDVKDESNDLGQSRLQLKFGPSAWFANEQDPSWTRTVESSQADYSRLFLTWPGVKEVRQSTVSIHDVLDGLEPADPRLHDEISGFLSGN
ncbi:PD-(D/E)XK nuclease family protein [Pseudarthrobacter sp. C1]|uniref:PD-(D/E)XK nuclease family protein n=1 Tax=Pseudarthrobacter sp. C1 TaxID=3108940 RepID=UPI002B054844|nr:PD-(D/E)XK nuclease family protein [Pseudarthrobacter sp. C1]MEA3549258.1 PD-(D/E)XK nuclease family protein [Pseudarthrobacter sp. C1]